jgi:hypothetical protein
MSQPIVETSRDCKASYKAAIAPRYAAARWRDRGVWLLGCISAGEATHETSDQAQAARSLCYTGRCATDTTARSDASGVGELAEFTAVRGDLISTYTSASRAAGGQ